MGQPHGKEAPKAVGKRPAPPGRGAAVVGASAAVRSQTVSDALLPGSSIRPAGPHADPAAGQSTTSFAAQQVSTQQPQKQQLPPTQPQPVVIRYKNTDVKSLLTHKAQMDLIVCMEADNGGSTASDQWKRFPMSRSEDNYFAVVELTPGAHKFRFQIGEQVRVDVSQLTTADPNSSQQEPCNVVHVSADLMNTKDDDDLIDDGTGWGQVEVAFDETRKYPPMLPPHLRYTPLNTPPTQVRCMNNGSLNVSNANTLLEPEHLPLPLSVTINHVYFQKREDHVVTGITTRYCNKFTTIAYYQGTTSTAVATQQPQLAY